MLPLIAALLTTHTRPARPGDSLLDLVAALAAFLAAAPYTVIDLPTFLNQFARLSSEYRGAGQLNRSGSSI